VSTDVVESERKGCEQGGKHTDGVEAQSRFSEHAMTSAIPVTANPTAETSGA